MKLRILGLCTCWVVATGAGFLAPSDAVAGASSPSGASVTFRGSVSGHLTTPASTAPNVTSQSGEIDFYHSLKGHSGERVVAVLHRAGWRHMETDGARGSSSLSLEDNGSISISCETKSGSFTVKGATGSVQVTLEPEPGSSGHGLVHVKGSCGSALSETVASESYVGAATDARCQHEAHGLYANPPPDVP